MATYYSILQSMFIFGCISCQYCLMVYRVNFVHVDITKMMPLKRVWEIFTQMSSSSGAGGGGGGGGNGDNATTLKPHTEKQLDILLARHKNTNDVPLHVYKGLTLCCRRKFKTLRPRPLAMHFHGRSTLTRSISLRYCTRWGCCATVFSITQQLRSCATTTT